MTVRFEVADHVATVTIARPDVMNAIDLATEAELQRIWSELEQRRDVRVIVLTGDGERAFCVGADMKKPSGSPTLKGVDYWAAARPGGFGGIALRETLNIPVIARVNGYALGAGLEVAAACDLRVASSNAVFGMPEVKVGIPSVVEAALLPGLIGWGRTRELLLFAENIDAPTALAWGLVDKVAPADGLDDAVEHTVKALLECGPEALRIQKELCRGWEELPLSESVNASVGAFGKSFLTGEPQRMMGGFLNRKR